MELFYILQVVSIDYIVKRTKNFFDDYMAKKFNYIEKEIIVIK